MLIDFTIKNYQAFKNEVSLNMLAASTVKECEDENNTIHNVWKLLQFMEQMVLEKVPY